ncbi:hypothetical protein RN001_000953 [Aquatica leii]|uniref:K Homology domain-containing protein n=1 Tax=Aquatica leii TaxID=1421715 RepID=A0AAN7PFK8_9COLE|nr:hypothetical protein RN001_000953 [Aquatica leii]
MSDYTAVAPPQQTFNHSPAFVTAVQRAKQIAAKINPGSTPTDRQKRPLEDALESESKKLSTGVTSNVPTPQVPQVPVQVATRLPPQNQGSISSGPSNLGVPPTMGGPTGPQFNEDIKVPDKMVGLIIGRGGEQITRLQSESGCKIQMAPDSGGLPERICSLSGNREAITHAKELIMNIVQQRGRTEGLGGMDLGSLPMSQNNFSGPGMNNSNSNLGGSRNFVEIMVPGPKVGLIIGKGGETIKQLQEKSGAKMVVIQDGPNQEVEKPLRISGDPSKVEYAKQLVYDLIAEKEMQAYNRRGGGGGGSGGSGVSNNNRNQEDRQQYNDYGNNEVEVLVPRAAVGVVIGKGGDMIKKIQAETGARVQFQQAKEEGPGERRCYLSGRPQNVDQARQRIEELIDSVCRREDGGGNRGGRGRDRFDNRGNRGGNQEFSGWNDERRPQQQQQQPQQQQPQEVTFVVPSSKCGVIIGRGGETIKQINQQSGAHCELDRRSQSQQDKTFIIRGEPDQIETAKRIISEKVQMPLNFVSVGVSNNLPTAYPGMAPQTYPPQNWGAPSFQQQWNVPTAGNENPPQTNPSVQLNPVTGQPDYSLQWAEYYRSLGMIREAEVIEQQAKTKGVAPAATQPSTTPTVPAATAAVPNPVNAASNGSQPDYSAQWADYYRSLGKHKEAEAIESQMKAKQAAVVAQQNTAQQMPTAQSTVGGTTPQPQPGNVYQQNYGAYQASGGYYGGQTQNSTAPPAMPQGQYGFSGYGYAQANSGQEN